MLKRSGAIALAAVACISIAASVSSDASATPSVTPKLSLKSGTVHAIKMIDPKVGAKPVKGIRAPLTPRYPPR